MSPAEFVECLTTAMLLDEEYTDREAKLAFALSMMTVQDEMETDRHTRMEFVEFIEAVRARRPLPLPPCARACRGGRASR